ncbi:hypothetical protein AHAS_Ahas19G0142500 [Arachis hypogaea]
MEVPKIDDNGNGSQRLMKEAKEAETLRDIHTMVKDDVSGVDDQINEVLNDIKKVSKEEMVMSILSTQTKHIQALTELIVQHSKVLEVLTASHLVGDRSGKKDKNLTEEVQDANSFQGKPWTKKKDVDHNKRT